MRPDRPPPVVRAPLAIGRRARSSACRRAAPDRARARGRGAPRSRRPRRRVCSTASSSRSRGAASRPERPTNPQGVAVSQCSEHPVTPGARLRALRARHHRQRRAPASCRSRCTPARCSRATARHVHVRREPPVHRRACTPTRASRFQSGSPAAVHADHVRVPRVGVPARRDRGRERLGWRSGVPGDAALGSRGLPAAEPTSTCSTRAPSRATARLRSSATGRPHRPTSR